MAANNNYDQRRDEILKEKQNLDGKMISFYNDLINTANQQQPTRNDIGQGQYVINKDILHLQLYIIDKFVERNLPQIQPMLNGLPISNIIRQARESTNYFEDDVRANIADRMKARIPAQNYIDRNALVYKEFIKILREAALKHMKHLHVTNNQGSPYSKVFQKTCSVMNEKEIYVDQDALKDWKKNQGGNETHYRRAKGCVERMLLRLKDNIPIWLGELRRLQQQRQA